MTNFHPETISTLVLQGIRAITQWQRIQPRNKVDTTINANLGIMYYYGLYLCCHHNAEANGKCLYFCFFEFLSKIFIHRGHHLTSLGSWGPAFSFSWGYGSCFLKAAFSFTSAVFMFEFLVAGKSSIPTSQLERERQCSKLLSSF